MARGQWLPARSITSKSASLRCMGSSITFATCRLELIRDQRGGAAQDQTPSPFHRPEYVCEKRNTCEHEQSGEKPDCAVSGEIQNSVGHHRPLLTGTTRAPGAAALAS